MNLRVFTSIALLFACVVFAIYGTSASRMKAPEAPYLMVAAAVALGAALWLVAQDGRNG